MSVEGRVADVSGAGGAMGAAVAVRLAEEGASLAICNISDVRDGQETST